MALELKRTIASFTGSCGAEEAAELHEWLSARRAPKADLSACTHLHSALLQLLLAGRVPISKPPKDPFLARWVAPLLPEAKARAAKPKKTAEKSAGATS
jgi:hypothetical protein